MTLGWEQLGGGLLHAYDGHAYNPVCGDIKVRRSFGDKIPRTVYVGPMPPPDEKICQICKTYERDHDPMFIAGRQHERELITKALSKESNRIFNSQESDFPSNTLDAVVMNLMIGETEDLTRKR